MIRTLSPQKLWNLFFQITQIPRASKHEEKMTAFLQHFAAEKRLECKTDKSGNVLIFKHATAGYENAPTVILQAHQDMVCEKNSDVSFDFSTDPIQTYIDGDWVKAHGTTLGADNGIGVAMALAVLENADIQHPALECLFTVDEETDLTGAFALENNFLTGKRLINLDSEDNGQIFIGCAGGIDTTATLYYEHDIVPPNYFTFKIAVSGLLGGHSGDDINKNRGNAIKIVNRFLWTANKKTDLYLVSFDGGNLHNAIAREATAIFSVPATDKENVRVWFNIFLADSETELRRYEPKFKLELSSNENAEFAFEKYISDRLFDALYACPHGIVAMSSDIAGLVETSTNLASVKMMEGNYLKIITSQRSSLESAKYDIANQTEAAFLLAHAEVTHGEGYPGWSPNVKSELLAIAQNAYERLFGETAAVRAIHAGLECGLFLKKYPQLDMISIGPQMHGVHSPDERVSIASTQKTWQWLVDILENAK